MTSHRAGRHPVRAPSGRAGQSWPSLSGESSWLLGAPLWPCKGLDRDGRLRVGVLCGQNRPPVASEPRGIRGGREASARRLQVLRAETLRAHITQSIPRAAVQGEPSSGAEGRPAGHGDAGRLASVLFSGANLWALIGVAPWLSMVCGISRQLAPPENRALRPIRAFGPGEEGDEKYGTLESVLYGAPPGASVGVTTWKSKTSATYGQPAPLKNRALQRPVFGFRPLEEGHEKNRTLESVLCSAPLGAPARRTPLTVKDLRDLPATRAAGKQGATAAFPSPSSPYYHDERNRFAVNLS